ncbi:hypothetical protein [Pseudofrankia sp. DC12]|uniref:hypothetical protein n=1 Tax=Pseudofrankia sp. DC12 TaxID=683315 RepID=UPI000AC39FA0|nr:hypothetical protein [Pseudofrankia sp. DC12]
MPTIGITGHRGLPADIEDYARSEILKILSRYEGPDLVGISCIADGPDSIFAQEVLNHGGQLTVVVPATRYREGLPETHHALYDELLGEATSIVALPHEASESTAHQDASERLVDKADLLIAVWDGQPSRGFGGTADVVAYAYNTGKTVDIVWPAGAQRP